jgi:hypothetical protein
MGRTGRFQRKGAALVAGLTWFGLVLQLAILISNALAGGRSILSALGTFFWYFTILTNLIVAVCTTARATESRPVAFLATPTALSAATLYISIVMVIYEMLLRGLFVLSGAQAVADVVQHDLVPMATILFWVFCVPKGTLHWPVAAKWLLYPLAYFVFALAVGNTTGRYPYPFVNVASLGMGQVLLNAVVLMVAFWALGLLFVLLDRVLAERRGM